MSNEAKIAKRMLENNSASVADIMSDTGLSEAEITQLQAEIHEERLEDARKTLRRSTSSDKTIAHNCKLDVATVKQLRADFDAVVIPPDVLAEATALLAERGSSTDKIAKKTGLDEYHIIKLKEKIASSPLEGDDASMVSKMLLRGMSINEVTKTTKLPNTRIIALVQQTLEGEAVDKAMVQLKSRTSSREIENDTGLHNTVVMYLQKKLDKMPLEAEVEAEVREKLLNGEGVGTIVKKSQTSVSHYAIRQVITTLEGESITKAKEMLAAGTHTFDVSNETNLTIDIINYLNGEPFDD